MLSGGTCANDQADVYDDTEARLLMRLMTLMLAVLMHNILLDPYNADCGVCDADPYQPSITSVMLMLGQHS